MTRLNEVGGGNINIPVVEEVGPRIKHLRAVTPDVEEVGPRIKHLRAVTPGEQIMRQEAQMMRADNIVVNNAKMLDNHGGLEVTQNMNNMGAMMNNNFVPQQEDQGTLVEEIARNLGNNGANHLLGEIEGFGNIGYANVL